MPITKEFKSREEQIEILKKRKLSIKDEDKAKDILRKYNYFDIINGFESILLHSLSPKLYSKVKFNDFVDVYKFDNELRKEVLFEIFDIESKFKTSLSYHFSNKHCKTTHDTLNYIDKAYYVKPSTADKYLSKKFNHFELFKKTEFDIHGKIRSKSFIDELKTDKPYIGGYTNPPFWVIIKTLTLGTVYFTYVFSDNDVKTNILSDFKLELKDSPIFEQAIYILKEVRNQCAHIELLTRFRLSRNPKLNNFSDLTTYAKLSKMDINLFDVIKVIKIFGSIKKIKKTIFKFYIKMCLKGRKRIANKILAKMGRKNIFAWLKA